MQTFTHGRGVVAGMTLAAVLGGTSLALAQDVSCYQTMDALREERDARVARCGSGADLTPDRAQCIANAEQRYRAALEALACRPAPLVPQAQSFVKRVTVPAREVLVDTGIDLGANCRVEIRTTGLWSNAGPPAVGAGGFVGYKHPGTILADADLAALVGVLSGPNSNHPGNGSGRAVLFPIGAATEFNLANDTNRSQQAPPIGRLLLGMNDVEGTFGDNRGALIVDLTVPAHCGEVTTTVAASWEWTDTGVAIPAGTELIVQATGMWSNVAGTPTLSAAGYQGYRHPGQRYAAADFASLIGTIGSVPFAIGAAKTVRTPAGGVLALGMNDVPGTFPDNVGALRVVIGAAFPCNGSQALCDRPFHRVAYATTHNSFATPGYIYPNQQSGIEKQLEAGIRGFMLDVYKEGPGLSLCHDTCRGYNIRLGEGLSAFASFLQKHPDDIVTMIIEKRASAARISDSFKEAGLLPYLYAQDAGAPWPTLREMILSGRRVLVMAVTGQESHTPAWLHNAWAIGWETNYRLRRDELVPGPAHCRENPKHDKERGKLYKQPGTLATLNHFTQLADRIGAEDVIAQGRIVFGGVNNPDRIVARAQRCLREGVVPNFVTVDFWESGDVVTAVRVINAIIPDYPHHLNP